MSDKFIADIKSEKISDEDKLRRIDYFISYGDKISVDVINSICEYISDEQNGIEIRLALVTILASNQGIVGKDQILPPLNTASGTKNLQIFVTITQFLGNIQNTGVDDLRQKLLLVTERRVAESRDYNEFLQHYTLLPYLMEDIDYEKLFNIAQQFIDKSSLFDIDKLIKDPHFGVFAELYKKQIIKTLFAKQSESATQALGMVEQLKPTICEVDNDGMDQLVLLSSNQNGEVSGVAKTILSEILDMPTNNDFCKWWSLNKKSFSAENSAVAKIMDKKSEQSTRFNLLRSITTGPGKQLNSQSRAYSLIKKMVFDPTETGELRAEALRRLIAEWKIAIRNEKYKIDPALKEDTIQMINNLIDSEKTMIPELVDIILFYSPPEVFMSSDKISKWIIELCQKNDEPVLQMKALSAVANGFLGRDEYLGLKRAETAKKIFILWEESSKNGILAVEQRQKIESIAILGLNTLYDTELQIQTLEEWKNKIEKM